MRLKRLGKDDKGGMLHAEKMLAYDPGNTDHMVSLLQHALKGGYYDTVLWMGPILLKANSDAKSPDYRKFIALRDVYKELRQWKLAVATCQYALMLRPDDMDLQTEMNHLAAQQTMDEGRYGTAGSFRDSIRDAKKQTDLMEADRDIRSEDSLSRAIADAEAEWQADPNEPGKITKLVETLVRTELPENEARAIDLLTAAHERTGQFRFRQAVGRIRMTQLAREERQRRAAVNANPTDDALKQQYADFFRSRCEEELAEFKLWAENYPTDMRFRYEAAVRLFLMGQYHDAIPAFQQARSDPKFRFDAAVYLGRAFLEAGFPDEAADTLRAGIDEYQLKGDAKSKEMHYWYGRALEQKKDMPAAAKCYSQVAQWDFNYRDVQARLKKTRAATV
jgi:TolA-binding protein